MSEQKNTFIFIYILTGLFFAFIFYQWLQWAPYRAEVKNPDNTWQQIGSKLGAAWESIGDNFALFKNKISDLEAETIKESKKQRLLQAAKKYLQDLRTSTSTSTTTADANLN